MKKLLANLKSVAGFTLIELLVVIGILGILASALIATIDPFEQLNKAQDSNLKNTTVEFLNSNIRYFTTHNGMPWDTAVNGGADCYATTDISGIALSSMTVCLQTLVDEGEIKKGFMTFNGLSKIFVSEPNPQTSRNNDLITCFKPASKSQQKNVETKYAQSGTNGANCKSTGGNQDCYWCAQ